jgi:hypothetical protein
MAFMTKVEPCRLGIQTVQRLMASKVEESASQVLSRETMKHVEDTLKH